MTVSAMLDLAIIEYNLTSAYHMMDDDYKKEADQLLVMICRINKDLRNMAAEMKKEI